MTDQSYSTQASGSGTSGSGPYEDNTEYWPLTKLRRCYTDYLFSKRQEIDEQIDARRYYHGSQWTAEQITVMKRRKQPIMTFNRVARKIDGVIGLLEKLRLDPKAFARTPQHEEGSELATAVVRYVLDAEEWKAVSPICSSDGAVDGIGGLSIEIEQGDQGDPDVGFEIVDVQSFFYDPRSYKDDFSDARYMGEGKWIDLDMAREMFPKADFDALTAFNADMTNSTDRELRWFSTEGVVKRVRLVDCWYKMKGGWCWAIFTGGQILMQGKSWLKDEKGKDVCKYVMFSGNVDQDGDRYGFVRNMKSAQDGINARQSKMQHILASNRLFISQSSGMDVEKTRTEMARPDGVVVIPAGNVNENIKTDDRTFDFAGWTKLLELNLQEIEGFGPNPQLLGEKSNAESGRAIQLLQQAGMAQLGPYMLAYRGWKLRVYRAVFNAVKQHWKAERWIRVTDNQDLSQFIQINGLQIDPQTGQPTLVNALGQLDVDIILDEGPDHVNAQADFYETLQNVLPSIAPLLQPAQAQSVVGLLVDTSPLPSDLKKRFKDEQQQAAQAAAQQGPPPEVQAEQAKAQIQLQSMQQQGALKTQQMAQDGEQKARQAEMELAFKTREAELELQIAQAKASHEMECMQQKNAMTMDVERQRGDQQINLETRKAQITTDQKQTEAKIRAGALRAAMDPEQAIAADNMDTIKGITTDFEKSIKEIASGFEQGLSAFGKEIAQALSQPKSINVKRDKTGRVVGAEQVPA